MKLIDKYIFFYKLFLKILKKNYKNLYMKNYYD